MVIYNILKDLMLTNIFGCLRWLMLMINLLIKLKLNLKEFKINMWWFFYMFFIPHFYYYVYRRMLLSGGIYTVVPRLILLDIILKKIRKNG